MKPPKWVDSLTCSISVPLPVLSDLLCLRAARTGVQWFEIVSCHISSESTYSRLEREKWYDSRSQSLSIIEAKVVSIWRESSFIQSIFYAPTPKPTSKENKKSGKSEYASSWRLAQSTFPRGLHFIFQGPCRCAKSFTVPWSDVRLHWSLVDTCQIRGASDSSETTTSTETPCKAS